MKSYGVSQCVEEISGGRSCEICEDTCDFWNETAHKSDVDIIASSDIVVTSVIENGVSQSLDKLSSNNYYDQHDLHNEGSVSVDSEDRSTYTIMIERQQQKLGVGIIHMKLIRASDMVSWNTFYVICLVFFMMRFNILFMTDIMI